MAPKRGLGKGLDALFPENVKAESMLSDAADDENQALPAASKDIDASDQGAAANLNAQHEQAILLDKLIANPDQPRKNFDDAELTELADSIREHGVIQPIIAEDAGDGTYVIVAGERRTRAAKLAGLEKIPAIIRAYSDDKRIVVSLIENIQRANLNPIEEAAAYKRLMDAAGLSQDEAAAQVGKNRSTVANAIRLLKLPEDMQKSLQEGVLTPGHARAILSLHGAKEQVLLYEEIIKKNLSVREAEKRATALGEQKKPQKEDNPPKPRSPEIAEAEEKLIKRLGTKVKINGDKQGTVVIEYYSVDDLSRLCEIIGE